MKIEQDEANEVILRNEEETKLKLNNFEKKNYYFLLLLTYYHLSLLITLSLIPKYS